MACCAFAVFLLLNLLAPFGWLRRFRRGGSRPNGSRPNRAVAWRYGQETPAPAVAPRPRWRRAVAGVVTVELLAATALAAYWLAPAPADHDAAADWDALVALHTVWCVDAAGPSDLTLGEP